MGLNNADYVEGLNPNDPGYNDLVANAASHVRAIKRSMKQTFPGITGAVTAGPTELNGIDSLARGRDFGLHPNGIRSRRIDRGRCSYREHLIVSAIVADGDGREGRFWGEHAGDNVVRVH